MFVLVAFSAAAQSEQLVVPQSIEVLDNEIIDAKAKRSKSFKTMQISGAGAGVSSLLVLYAIFGEVPEAVGVICIGTGVISSAIFLVSTVKTIVCSIKIIKANRKKRGVVY